MTLLCGEQPGLQKAMAYAVPTAWRFLGTYSR